MNADRWIQITLGLFVGAALVGIVLFLSAGSPGNVAVEKSASSTMSIDQTAVVSGTYTGLADLHWVLTGVYSQTLATPTPMPGGSTEPGHVGDLDLSLRLEQAGNQVSGYVVLERSLAFPEQHTVMVDGEELAIGPRVSGTYDGTTLRLQSERFSIVMSPERKPGGGQTISERRVTRQFSLTSTSVDEAGAKLSGEYRETLWGFDIKPSTVVGAFAVDTPVVVVNVPTLGPTTTPTQAGTTVPDPTATPGGSTATPGGSTATPGGSTATPGGPTATPGDPTATPGDPTATPGGPTATPLGGENRPIFLPILQPLDGTDTS